MKKRWIGCGMALVLISAMTMPALADSVSKRVDATLRSDYKIVLDGKEMNFKQSDGASALALVYDGTTYLPLRAIGEALGKDVDWNGKTKTITLTSTTDADGTQGKKDTAGTTQTKAKDIGAEQAKKLALNHAGLKESQVYALKTETDWENGKKEYEVEFKEGRMEYSYEVDAETGKILKAEKEYDD